MSKIKQFNFFKIISIVLITAFIALDISWAYPPEYNTKNSTLAAPSLFQQNPMTEQAARFQQSIFSQGELLGSVCAIGKYLLEEKLPIKYLDQVISTELGKAASVIDLSYVMVKDGIVLIPCEIKGKRRIIQIALKSNLAAKDLIGYEWLVSNKYVIKELPEDYVKEPAAKITQEPAVSPAPIVETKEEPKVKISEPVAEVSAPATKIERYHGIIDKIFTVRAITVLSALAAAVILAFPQFAVAASGESVGFFSSGNIVWIIYVVAASVAVFYLMKWAKTTTVNNIIDEIAAEAWKSTGFLNVYITNEPNAHLFLIGTITEEEPSILSSALLINAHIIKQRWFIWLWKNHNSLLREIIGVDLYQRSVFAKESEDILAALKRKGYKNEKDLGYQSAFFSEINKRAYPHIGARGAALDVWFYRFYLNPLYAVWRDDKNWIIKQARKYLAKEYSWMNDTQVWEVINEIYKIDNDYFNPKKSSTTLNFIGLSGLGPAALMSVFLAARDFAIAHPVIAGIAAFGIGVTAFFAAWRVFFSLNWHVFWLKHGGHFNVSHEEVLAKIGPLAVPYLKIALADKDSFVRSKAAEALDKIGWQPESLELKIVYLFAKQRWGALVEIGAPAIPILVTASYDRDLYVSYPAAKALDNIKYRIAAEPFIKILNDKNSSMHPEAAAALSNIGWKPETKEENIAYLIAKKDWTALAKKDVPAAPALIKLLSYHKHWYVRSKAAETLGSIEGQGTREHLIKALNDVDPHVRLAAATALDKKEWEPKTQELKIAYLFAKQDWEALVKIGAPAIPTLVKAFSDNSFFIRSEAVITSGNIKDPEAIAPLIEVLSDNNPSIQLEAAKALDKIGWEPKTEEQTIAYLFARQDWEALVEIGAPAIPILEKASCNHDWYISSPAAKALGNIKGQQGQEQGVGESLENSEKSLIKILCVCNGNMNRSPAMEMVFNYLIEKKGLSGRIYVNSGAAQEEPGIAWGKYNERLIEAFKLQFHEEPRSVVSKLATSTQVQRADIIFVPNEKVKQSLTERFKNEIAGKRIIVLDELASSLQITPLEKPSSEEAAMLYTIKNVIEKAGWQEVLSQVAKTDLSAELEKALQEGNFNVIEQEIKRIYMLIKHYEGCLVDLAFETRVPEDKETAKVWQNNLEDAREELSQLCSVISRSDKLNEFLKSSSYYKLRQIIDELHIGYVFVKTSGIDNVFVKAQVITEAASIGAAIKQELKSIKTISMRELFTLVQPKVPESMQNLRQALDELKPLSEQKDVSADTISQAIAQAKEKHSLSDDETKILWLALTGPGQGLGDSLENSAKKTEINSEEGAAPSTVTQLFEIVESSVNNERAEFIKAGNHLIGLIKAQAVVESAEYFPLVERIDKKMAAAGIRQGLDRAISAMEGLEKENVTPEIRNTAEFLKKNLDQFEADSAAAAIIVLARRAKRNNQKLIIGLETDWIPGLDKEKSYQQNAIHTLMQEIYAIGETLKSMGLDNVEVIRGNSGDLANKLLNEADETHTDLRNVVVMASTTTITSLSFAPLRDADENNRPFLAGIDTTEIIKFYETFGETLSNQLYIRLTQMLYMTLELAAGKEPPQTPMIVSYDSKQRLVIFLPKAEPMDYDTLRSTYAAEKTALSAA